jgi:hypothetical protein
MMHLENRLVLDIPGRQMAQVLSPQYNASPGRFFLFGSYYAKHCSTHFFFFLFSSFLGKEKKFTQLNYG